MANTITTMRRKDGSTYDRVQIENARFFINRDGYGVNFEGHPKKDAFGGNQRKGTLIIPYDFAKELDEHDVKVYIGAPSEEYDEPLCLVDIKLSFTNADGEPKSNPPIIYLEKIENGRKVKVPLDEYTVKQIDESRIANVKAMCSTSQRDGFQKSLWINVMYCELAVPDDPWANEYSDPFDEGMPFD